MSSELPQLVAHRGYPDRYPENTLTGVQAAIQSGALHVEFDVQMSADKQLVVLHDDSLTRTADIDSSVFGSSLPELQKVSVHEPSRFGQQYHPEYIASLAQMLRLIQQHPAVTAYVEVKQESIERWGMEVFMQQLLHDIEPHAEQCVVISFDDEAIAYVREHTDLRTGWVLHRYDAEHEGRARSLQADILICNQSKVADEDRLWSGNWQWMLYGVEDVGLARYWAQHGVAYVETDRIGGLIEESVRSDDKLLHGEQWDIIVIGAGIHGAGVAQAAAADGYKVLLLEQYPEPAQATSCKSSKLIHGGLRYLESAEFALVHECLRERSILLKVAPHLVELKPFCIPVYRDTRRRPWKITLGLMLYSVFSFRRFHRIRKKHWSQLDGLSTDDLDAVFSYYDAQTDDAELTRAVIASAESIGATVCYNARVDASTHTGDGMELQCDISGDKVTLDAKLVVNATGAWVDKVHNELVGQKASPVQVSLVQGAHIVLPGNVSHPYYLESPDDGRAVFVLPWKDNIMVGTTETEFTGDPAHVEATAEEVDYLLAVYNHYFTASHTTADVVESFAGLRVLPAGEGAAFKKSRDTIFLYDDETSPRVISILGGKLTAYRATAEKLMSGITKTLPQKKRLHRTDRLKLPVLD